MNRLLAVTAVVACVSGAAHAADTDLVRFNGARAAAEAALKAGDLAGAETQLKAALAIFPLQPAAQGRLVTVQAMRGEIEAGAASAKALADAGILLDLDRPDRAALKTSALYPAIAAKQTQNARAVGALAWTLPLDVATPLEGVAYDAAGRRLLLGSIGEHAVLAGDMRSGFKPLIAKGAAGGLFGLAYDPARKTLWAAEASGPGVPRSQGEAATGIVKIDPADGAVLARFPAPDGKHLVGDVLAAPDGSVFASDAVGGEVYRLRPGADRLETLVPAGTLASPQGFALSADGEGVIVSDYTTGLWRIDLASGGLARVNTPAGTALYNLDGLAARGSAVYATQNGTAPSRLLRLTFTADGRRVTAVETIAANLDDLSDMALAAVAVDELVLVGKSGWAGFDEDGKPSRDVGKPVLAAVKLR